MTQTEDAPRLHPGNYLVIGDRGGLGSALSDSLAAADHTVVGLDLPEIDLSKSGLVGPRLESLWQERGPFDGLVYSAGLFPAIAALDTTEEDFDRVMSVNARSALIAASTMARLCRDNGTSASIVMVSSGAAARPQVGTTLYAASKAALEATVRGLALEMGPFGIRVNAVAPGFVDVGSKLNPVPEEYVQALASSSPRHRVATAADIIPSILWLLGSDSDWINGQTITVDGGACLGSIDKPHWLRT